jgi:hypothetical protein
VSMRNLLIVRNPHPAKIDNSQRRWPDCGENSMLSRRSRTQLPD